MTGEVVTCVVCVSLALGTCWRLGVWLAERQCRRDMLRMIRDHPGILASDLATCLGLEEVETRVMVRVLEGEGKLTTIPAKGDRRCWVPRA